MPSILVCTFPVIETKYAYEFRNRKRQEDVLSGAEDSDPSGTPTIKLIFGGEVFGGRVRSVFLFLQEPLWCFGRTCPVVLLLNLFL